MNIDKNIPMPVGQKKGVKGSWLKIIEAMEVGDSILRENCTEKSTAISYIYKVCQRYNLERSWAARREGNGFRVWRTA